MLKADAYRCLPSPFGSWRNIRMSLSRPPDVPYDMRSFRDLVVWQKSRAVLLRLDPIVKRIERGNPRLADQLRRTAESVPEALAEGCGRATDKDVAHYVSMASGSASEVENQIQRAFDLALAIALAC
jgi:four helix bundle protein